LIQREGKELRKGAGASSWEGKGKWNGDWRMDGGVGSTRVGAEEGRKWGRERTSCDGDFFV